MTEAKVSDYLKKQLDKNGIFYERVNTMGVMTETGMRKDLAAIGRPDFFVFHEGRAYAIETKSSTGKLRLAQELWAKRFVHTRIEYYKINSKEGVDTIVLKILSNSHCETVNLAV